MSDPKLIIHFVAIGLCGLSTIFCILALCLNTWHNDGLFTFGLWKVCAIGKCGPWTIVPGKLQAVRAFAFLGLFLIIGAAVSSCLHAFVMKTNNTLINISLGSSISSGSCMGIAFIVFIRGEEITLGAGIYMCIAAWLFGWIVGLLNGRLVVLTRRAPNN